MTSDYERKKFRRNYLIVAAVFIAVSFAVLVKIGYLSYPSEEVLFLLILAALLEITVLVIVYHIASKEVKRAYKAVEKTAEMMDELMKDADRDMNTTLEEGSIGILNSNFEKLVNMFREGKRREAEEKEFLKDVMSDISHQLKTPLASLNVFIDLLLNDKLETEEEKKKILSEAENQMSRMEWMVLSMLKLARIEARVIDFDIKKASVSTIIGEVQSAVHYLTDAKNQKIMITFPDMRDGTDKDAEERDGREQDGTDDNREIYVMADPEWLTEALINIVKNASDYSDEGSDIEMRVETNNVFTRIYIEDHGMGIPESELPNIFKRFYRVSNEVNPNSVGIGLALSKSIVEGLNGQIRVNSKIKEGTEFQIQIPTAE